MGSVTELLSAAERSVAASRWNEARRQFAQVLEIAEHVDALLHLSYIESNAGNYSLARTYALRAHATHPRASATVIRLLNRLRSFNEAGAIHALINDTPELYELEPRSLHAVAAHLSYLGEQEHALRYLDKALAKQADSPPLLLARSQVNTFLGRFDAAERDLTHCLRLAPGLGGGWWALSRLRKQTLSSNHVDPLRRQLAAVTRPAGEVAYLAYALHKELDDLGDVAGAAEALNLACRSRRSELEYSDMKNKAMFARLMSLPLTLNKRSATAFESEFTAVFIVGMYRSGTTLLEQLLGGNTNVLNAGELQDVTSCMRNATNHHCHGAIDEEIISRSGGVDFSRVGEDYMSGVEWRLKGQTHVTDKWPDNFLNIGFICQALPGAKILHMVRDPMETCFSNLRESFSTACRYSYDQAELASYYRQYEGLMEHWHRMFPGRILDVDYRRLTSDTESVMREVSSFCGLEFVPSMIDPRSHSRSVATASAIQVRSAIISRSTPKWEPYREYLKTLIEGLAGCAEQA